MEAPLAVPQDRLVPGHIPRPHGDHRLVPTRVYGGRTRLSGHLGRAALGLPGPLLLRRAVIEAVRTERAPGYPDRDPPRRRAADFGPLLSENPDPECARTLHEPDDGALERDGHPAPVGLAKSVHVPGEADEHRQCNSGHV